LLVAVHEALVLTLATRAILRSGVAGPCPVRKGCGLRHRRVPYPRSAAVKDGVFDYERRVNPERAQELPLSPVTWIDCRRAESEAACRVSSMSERATASDRPPEPFRCDIEPSHGKVHVIPRGEIDLASVTLLEVKLRELRETGFDHLVMDLREVAFMDSTGLRLILSWDEQSHAEGVDFELIAGPPLVQRLFEITGVTSRLRFVEPTD
jgi:anti-anti-sigma factor